jgi:hypothetical protein
VSCPASEVADVRLGAHGISRIAVLVNLTFVPPCLWVGLPPGWRAWDWELGLGCGKLTWASVGRLAGPAVALFWLSKVKKIEWLDVMACQV